MLTPGASRSRNDAALEELATLSVEDTEPTLVALSGEKASFLAGGEFPIPVVQGGSNGDGGDAITVEFKPFGVSLGFTPTVLGDKVISMIIEPEVSSIDPSASITINGLVVPGLQTRRANSTIELPSGGGIMIAGLLQDDIENTINGVPGLMDLPILGTLFRSTEFQRNETELVILVSVMLAKPVDPDLLASPTDGFAPANDLDRYFIGNLQNIYVKRPPDGSQPTQGPKGPIGYIIN